MPLALRVRPRARTLPASEVVVLFSDGKVFELPASVARSVRPHLQRAGFKGEAHETHAVPLPGPERRVIFVVGTGDRGTTDIVRRGVAAGVQYARSEGLRTLAVVGSGARLELPAADIGRVVAHGALLARYRFTTYKEEAAKRERRFRLVRLELFVPPTAVTEASAGVRRGTTEVAATILARDLVNTPSAHLTPRTLADQARAIAQRGTGVTVRVFGPREIERLGMGAYAAVARGADEPPQFIHLRYTPPGGARRKVVLVGKGLTFDSGGYSIKTAEGMETMKIDMAGAAVVLGVFSVLPRWQQAVEVHGVIAACENLISGRAMRPGDIVRAKSGKTIEILNTDAEGRLTLADALAYAVELKPDAVIDLATLTGACVVALGDDIAGLFSNDEALVRAVEGAAAASGEGVWRMPLPRDYRELLKSEIADIQNIGSRGRAAGAITAALFLQEFVAKTPWVHLDIAGPSYAEKQHLPHIPAGGTGFGVRIVLRYLENLTEGSRQ